jgi:hypothetical protein
MGCGKLVGVKVRMPLGHRRMGSCAQLNEQVTAEEEMMVAARKEERARG